jgi:CRP/FNR family cyclic AMP-dependent transcriptional regulator
MTLGTPAAHKRKKFDPKIFLSVVDGGKQMVTFAKKKTIFLQGEPSDSVLYIQKGKVQLTVTSKTGREAVIGLLKEGDFLGENCLAGEPLRLCTATALTDCSLMQIDRKTMMNVGCLRFLWRICWHVTLNMRPTWLTSFSIPAKNGWRGYC